MSPHIILVYGELAKDFFQVSSVGELYLFFGIEVH